MSDGQGEAGAAGAAGDATGAGGGEGAGGGSAADILGGAAAGGGAAGAAGADAGAGGGAVAADGGDGGDGGAGGEGGAGADPALESFLGQFSADVGEGEGASLRDWVKSRGYKSHEEIAKSARDNQRALRDTGRVKIPGDDASDEDRAAFAKALGVPEKADEYAAPELLDAEGKPILGEDGQPIAMDGERLQLINGLAHSAPIPIPAASLKHILDGIAKADYEGMQASEAELSKQAQEHAKSWGADRDTKLAAVDAAGKLLGLDRSEMLKLRASFGPARALDMMAKLGARVSEDTMLQGGGQWFMGDPKQAQAEIDAMKADPVVAAKAAVKGTPENQRLKRLQAVRNAGLQAQGADAGL